MSATSSAALTFNADGWENVPDALTAVSNVFWLLVFCVTGGALFALNIITDAQHDL